MNTNKHWIRLGKNKDICILVDFVNQTINASVETIREYNKLDNSDYKLIMRDVWVETAIGGRSFTYNPNYMNDKETVLKQAMTWAETQLNNGGV